MVSSRCRSRLRQRPDNLAFMYDNGRGVPQDYAEALKWSRLAADQGFAAAQYNLAFAYANGQGVPQDYTEAAKWSRLAADQGFLLLSIISGSCTPTVRVFLRTLCKHTSGSNCRRHMATKMQYQVEKPSHSG